MPSKSLLSNSSIDNLYEFFKLLGDRTRIRIILALVDGPRSVGQLCDDLDKLAQPTVSHHLSLLRAGKVITNKRKGKEVHYSLNIDFLDRLGDEVLDQIPGTGKAEIKAGRFVVRRSAKPAGSRS